MPRISRRGFLRDDLRRAEHDGPAAVAERDPIALDGLDPVALDGSPEVDLDTVALGSRLLLPEDQEVQDQADAVAEIGLEDVDLLAAFLADEAGLGRGSGRGLGCVRCR